MGLRVNATEPGVRQKRTALAEFLHPRVVPPIIDAMLDKVRPSSSARVSEAPLGARRNVTANNALAEFQLESRIALIQSLCRESEKGEGGR